MRVIVRVRIRIRNRIRVGVIGLLLQFLVFGLGLAFGPWVYVKCSKN